MKALTIWQPWIWAILELPPHLWKDVENRTWAAPWIKGRAVALHAGLKFDEPDTWDQIEEATGVRPPPRSKLVVGSIIGAVVVEGFVVQSPSMWFRGPVGWQLGRRWKASQPVPCTGAQGLWEVPPAIAEEVKRVVRSTQRELAL